MTIKTDAAVLRFGENEERVNIFVNENGNYVTSEGVSVETLPSFMQRMKATYLAYSNRGNWQTSIAYDVQDLVIEDSFVYLCVEAHTSGTFATDLASGKWVLYQGAKLSDFSANDGASKVGYARLESGAVPTTVQAKLREKISVEDFGGNTGGTAANNLSAFNSLISAVGSLWSQIDLNGRSYTLSDTPLNKYGVRFINGKVIVPSGSGTIQINTYAEDASGLMFGRENLAAWWKSVSAGTSQTVYIYGDSTVEMNEFYPLKSHELFKEALLSSGVNNCNTVNRGVSGSSWSDLNAIPDFSATTTKLIVIKYGINDAVKSNALATIAADARTKLSAIRGATNGSFDKLSILLMGPNSTYRPSTGQTATWYESLRNLYIQLCKEFNCAYFDTYAYLQSSKLAPGIWQDNIAASGEGLHPDPVAAYWIWYEGIRTYVLGDGQWNTKKANQIQNVTHATKQRYPTDPPSTFPLGFSLWSVLASDGWPFNGVMIVFAGADGSVEQSLRTLDVVPRKAMRSGGVLADVWSQWAGVPTAVTTFLNSWANKTGGYGSAGYQVEDDGFVTLYGVISGGTNGASAFTLPALARPEAARNFAVSAAADGSFAVGTVVIFADGNVIPYSASNETLSLDGIRFKAKA